MNEPQGLGLCHAYNENIGHLSMSDVRALFPGTYPLCNWLTKDIDIERGDVPTCWDIAHTKLLARAVGFGQSYPNSWFKVQNEPDSHDQATLDPKHFVDLMMNWGVLGIGYAIAPNVSIVFESGQKWLMSMIEGGGLQYIDALGIHIHGLQNGDRFVEFWEWFKANIYFPFCDGLGVHITEFSPIEASTPNERLSLLEAVTATLGSDPTLRSAWYFVTEYPLPGAHKYKTWPWSWLLKDGEMTEYGRRFREMLQAKDYNVYLPFLRGAYATANTPVG